MSTRSRQIFRIILGAIIISGALYLSIRFLFKGSPMMKIFTLLLNVAITYLTVDTLLKQNKKDKYGK